MTQQNKGETRTIQCMDEKHWVEALDLVQQVFTDHENETEGKLVRSLVEEIRSKKYYLQMIWQELKHRIPCRDFPILNL